MQYQRISKPNNIYLNSFRPLCKNEIGRRAIIRYNHHPYIDASCRREPDLESVFPTISSICRQGHFAPRPRMVDIVVYITGKQKYYGDSEGFLSLSPILKIYLEEIQTPGMRRQLNLSNLKNCR